MSNMVIGSIGKFELLSKVLGFDKPGDTVSLLDVGCRGCELARHLPAYVSYQGADLFQNPAGTVNHVIDLEKGLPFPDGAFHHVVALDVVEHVDNLDFAVEELIRTSAKSAVIIIPNLAHFQPRLRFLFTARTSEKYEMRYPAPRDRHRWFSVQPDADRYFESLALAKGLNVETVWYLDGPKKSVVSRLLRIVGFRPSWWVWASVYVVSKKP